MADGGGGRVARGQHGIDDDGIALAHVVGHFVVVLDRLQGLRVAKQANVADARAGHDVEHAVQKAVARAQDGHQHQFFAVDDFAGGGLQRGFNFDLLQRHVARELVGHQRGQLAQHAPKAVGAGFFAAHQGQFVLDEGVVNQVNSAHGGAGKWG